MWKKAPLNPLVFACTGGTGQSATKVITRLAAKINEKESESYADAISYIRTKIRFAFYVVPPSVSEAVERHATIHQCYSSRGRAVIYLIIPRVLTMKPYNFRRSIKFEIHCPNS